MKNFINLLLLNASVREIFAFQQYQLKFAFIPKHVSAPQRNANRVQFGDLKVSEMGIGTWAWGNRFVYQYEQKMDDELQEAFNICINAGLNWFDSADSYGTGKFAGRSELLLGKFIKDYSRTNRRLGDDIKVATKFAPYPYRIGKASMHQACSETLSRLDKEVLDVAQLHWPPPFGWQEKAYLKGLAELKSSGAVREIGLSNYGPKGMKDVAKTLRTFGASLTSNQVQFSLISTAPLKNGLIDTCRELNVVPISYSPLGLGLLTGKYSMNNVPPGPRGLLFKSLLPKLSPLLDTLTKIGENRKKTCGQVAINWTICKGALPIVGIKSVQQAKENIGAIGWRLSQSEIDEIDRVSLRCNIQTQQNIFQTD